MSVDGNVDDQDLEIEIKLEVKNPAELLERVRTSFFTCVSSRAHEYNIVFDTSDRNLTGRNILLRLRRWGGENRITLKSPTAKQDLYPGYKVRRETDIIVDDFEKTVSVFSSLGFLPIFRYEKFRSAYRSPEGLLLTLDETPIGCYIELEGKPWLIDRYISVLGYRPDDALCKSYRSLFFSSGGEGDMLFDR